MVEGGLVYHRSLCLEVPLENYLEGDGRSPPWSPWSRSCGEYGGKFDPYLSSALVAEMVWGWSCLSQVPVSGGPPTGRRRKVSSLVSLVQVLWSLEN